MIQLETATPEHVELFRRELTPADDAEAQACGCANAFAAFSQLRDQSLEAFALVLPAWCFNECRVAAMLGVRPRAAGDGAQLWFHSTELFRRYPLACLRVARPLFDGLLERHGTLHGMINPENPAMIRLATWLGMQLDAVQQVGAFTFHPAVVRRQHHG